MVAMSKPTVHAFFLGRALAEGVYEFVEQTLTNTLSELGKFDAQQRQQLRQFTEQVLQRSDQQVQSVIGTQPGTSDQPWTSMPPADLQAMIDDLRAEIAQVRSELQRYRSSSL